MLYLTGRWPPRLCGKKVGMLLTSCLVCCMWPSFFGSLLMAQSVKVPLLLVVSFDGFRWDYLDMVREAGHHTPVFDSLIADGVRAKWVKNSYVTLTLPNHYSIATGMFEENHGVVSNQMYDPVYNETFHGTSSQLAESRWWNNGSSTWQGVPIWLANQRKPGHYSGVYFWAGSEAQIRGQRPRYSEHYNWSVPYTKRVDTVVQWFVHSVDPINFAMLYFEDPDFTGHRVGPESLEMIERILELDEILGYVVNSIKECGLFSDMNLIVTSDHGMSRLLDTVYLDDYVSSDISYSVYGRPPVLHLHPEQESQLTDLYDSLQQVPHVYVYKKDDIPREYHYKNNRRILDIVLEAHEGYLVCKDKESCLQQSQNKGDHGYNNSLNSMHPIFIAHGPAFRRSYVSEPFDIVDIYPLMCHVLGVQPGLHDGQFENIRHILVSEDNNISLLSETRWASLTALAAVLGCVLLVVGIYFFIKYIMPATDWKQESHPLQQTTESQLLLTKNVAEDMV